MADEERDEPLTPDEVAIVRAHLADEDWLMAFGFDIRGGYSAEGVIRGLLALIDQPRHLQALNAVLRPQGFHLAAYLTEHQRHGPDVVRSDCRECMDEAFANQARRREAQGRHALAVARATHAALVED